MAFFRKVIEWLDESKDVLVNKVAIDGKDINNKSKLIVRPSQMAIFVYKGKIADIFPEGTYSLNTGILPILTTLGAWQYGFKTPIAVDVYYITTKQFTGNKWGTTNPIIMRDPEFGVVRVRGYGVYSFKVDEPAAFLTELFGTNSSFQTGEITEYLKSMIISTLTDAIGESKISALDLAGNALEFGELVKKNVQEKFQSIGLKLMNFVVENLSVPSEIEKALDERTKLGIMEDKTDVMMKVAAAEAMKDAAKNTGMGGAFMGAGVGVGAGMGMGQMMAEAFKGNNNSNNNDAKANSSNSTKEIEKCPKCKAEVKGGSKFCPECGAKMNAVKFCPNCGAKTNGKFCPECGTKIN